MKLAIGDSITLDIGDTPISFLDAGPVRSKLPKSQIVEIATELLDNQTNKTNQIGATVKSLLPLVLKFAGAGNYAPIISAVEGIYAEVRKRKEEKEEKYTLMSPETSRQMREQANPMLVFQTESPPDDTLIDGFSIEGLRNHRVNRANLLKALVNIDIKGGQRLKDIRWKEPKGWEKGKTGFFCVAFDKNKQLIVGSETYASHGRTTRMTESAPNAKYVLIAHVNHEGRGPEVYGRSKIERVK